MNTLLPSMQPQSSFEPTHTSFKHFLAELYTVVLEENHQVAIEKFKVGIRTLVSISDHSESMLFRCGDGALQTMTEQLFQLYSLVEIRP
jgi:hypothetical protein